MIFYKLTSFLRFLSFLAISCIALTACQPDQTSPNLSLIELHNHARQKGISCQSLNQRTAPKLAWNPQLAQVAHEHSIEISSRKRLSHIDSSNNRAGVRLTAAAYNWQSYAENLAHGVYTDSAAFELWLNSQAHCENIINPAYTEMGAAQVTGQQSMQHQHCDKSIYYPKMTRHDPCYEKAT